MEMPASNQDKPVADLRKSCDLCCSRKRRCDGDGLNPCSLCTQKEMSCTYSKKERRGPKPKTKRHRDSGGVMDPSLGGFGALSVSHNGDVDGEGGLGGGPGMLNWVGGHNGGAQPPHKTPRIADIVRLSPSQATGMLGLAENRHLNSFFSGFGACTQIVQEDEIRGAMIHILSEGQFGMPIVGGRSFYSSSSGEKKTAGGGSDQSAEEDAPDLPLIRLPGGGLGIPGGGTEDGKGTEEDRKQRAQRARLSAGVACLWAGIGVGAMLCGQTAEATMHYAENAREAIKGCYDVVSEEVLRAFLCLAHMHSFREDFPKFFRYTAMANDVATSLDRQGEEAAAGKLRPGGYRGPTPKGCSEPAKFLLKCFDALRHFLELEGEEIDSPLEGLRAPESYSSARSSVTTSSTSSVRSSATSDSPGPDPVSTSAAPDNGAPTSQFRARAAVAAIFGGGGDSTSFAADGKSNPAVRGAAEAAAAMAVDELEVRGRRGGDGAGPVDARARAQEKENEPRMLSHHEVSAVAVSAMLAGDLRSHPPAVEDEKYPGMASAARVQKCIRVLGDNPVAQHLGSFAVSSWGSLNGRRHPGGGETKRQQPPGSSIGDAMVTKEGRRGVGSWGLSGVGETKEEAQQGGTYPGCRKAATRFPPLKMNQVLFVGDTRILEVSMGVDCSCMSVMCKAVSGADWSEVRADALLVANAADAILVPVLASPSISRSVCAVKLLADTAFSHLCLGNSENALRAVRRFCAILKEFPGIMRFPPWRHCFHWMAGMLESAGLRDHYEGLRNGLNTINMKSMRSLPEFGNAAHDVMCKCSHFRCQATHRALAEHAKRDPYGAFHVPAHCPQFGTKAKVSVESTMPSFRSSGPAASEWASKLKTTATSSCSAPHRHPPAAQAATAPAPAAPTAVPKPVRPGGARAVTRPAPPAPQPTSAQSPAPGLFGISPAPPARGGKRIIRDFSGGGGGVVAGAPVVASQEVAGAVADGSSGGGGGAPHPGHLDENGWRAKVGDSAPHPQAPLPSSSFDAFAAGLPLEQSPPLGLGFDRIPSFPGSGAVAGPSAGPIFTPQVLGSGSTHDPSRHSSHGEQHRSSSSSNSSSSNFASGSSSANSGSGGSWDNNSRSQAAGAGSGSNGANSSRAGGVHPPRGAAAKFSPAFGGSVVGVVGRAGGAANGAVDQSFGNMVGGGSGGALLNGVSGQPYSGGSARGGGGGGGGGLMTAVGGTSYSGGGVGGVGGRVASNIGAGASFSIPGGGAGLPSNLGVGATSAGVANSQRLGTGPGIGTGIATGLGTVSGTVPGGVPDLHSCGRSLNSNGMGYHFGGGDMGLASNGGSSDPVSEFADYSKEDQQLWAALSDVPEMGVADMVIEMDGGRGQSPSDLEVFAHDLVGMLSDESKA